MKPVVYACVTAGYDNVAPVSAEWGCDFVLFHDGSVAVPPGWRGQRLEVHGLSGVDLNRYAKLLPHRLGLPSSQSMYIDGNIILKQDPQSLICAALTQSGFAAYPHATRDCAYAEIREAMRLGFIGPQSAWRPTRDLRRAGVPRRGGLFWAGLLLRRHNDPSTVTLDETWWRMWRGGMRRDQPLLSAAIWQTGVAVHAIGRNDIENGSNQYLYVVPHARSRPRRQRLPHRLAAELSLYRLWLPR